MPDFLLFNTQIVFISLSIVAIIDYIRHRNPRRRDFALLVSALGLPFAITLLRTTVGFRTQLTDLIGAFTLFAQPYFLFRLLEYIRPSRRGVGIVIVVGLLLSYVLLWNLMAVNAALTVTIIFSYCAVVEAYCTWGFYQGLSGTQGTLRRRLSIIAVSSAIFTLAFIINVIKAQLPTLSPNITPIAQAAASISAVLFYVAFIPPRWLRRAWQMEEVYDYLSQVRVAPASNHFVMDHFQQLSRVAVQAATGSVGGVLKLNDTTDTWEIVAATEHSLFMNLLPHIQPLVRRSWQGRQALTSLISDIPDANERRRLQALGVQTSLLVPIQSAEEPWGLLIVALRDRSLFIDDDLSMLDVLAHECALVLDNHRLIDELRSYTEQLEQKVEERTAALQRSNEELRRYAYVASHDLQEPLRTVTSYLQLIELRFPDKLDKEGREFIAYAVGGAKRMKDMINDLLTYSRVENRKRQFATIDVQHVLDKTEKILDGMIAEADARITHDPLPKLVADEELILHLFQNLIENAIKYRSERPPEIHIGARCKDEQWTFSIRDNGIGIEPQYLERIFVIFQRLHTHEEYPGTGIGLAICKKVVEVHEGRIWAESEVGQGTAFHFTIPVRSAPSELPLASAS